MNSTNLLEMKKMTDHKHYIIDKHTKEVQHGPFPDAAAAEHAADHFDWFDNDQHEIVHGSLHFGDEDHDDIDGHETEEEDHGTHGWFIMHADCEDPIAGPFETADEADDKEYKWLGKETKTIEGMISSDGKFYPH